MERATLLHKSIIMRRGTTQAKPMVEWVVDEFELPRS
jgi:hypothetical protein